MTKTYKFLTKAEILTIPKLVKKLPTLSAVALSLGIHDRTLDNHIKKLREAGYTVETKRGKRLKIQL